MPPIKASRLVGLLINVAYYTGKTTHECSCVVLDLQGEAKSSRLSLINQAPTKTPGAGTSPTPTVLSKS